MTIASALYGARLHAELIARCRCGVCRRRRLVLGIAGLSLVLGAMWWAL